MTLKRSRNLSPNYVKKLFLRVKYDFPLLWTVTKITFHISMLNSLNQSHLDFPCKRKIVYIILYKPSKILIHNAI